MDIVLLVAMAALLVFMFWSSRRRAKRMKDEQEAKARAMLPGVKVLLQGGLYGTLVEYDGEDLSKSARVELAPGMEVEVHSQAILRVVDETEETVTEDEYLEAEADQAEYAADVADGEVTSISDDRAAADTATDKTEPGDKPQA
ncbi:MULTISPECIES: preprotein translocase subunit YajC [Microbacterium]|jgi:preprotein translocase subunit YajC|uniref:Preprotein translocase subunit YajC n=1 Tax=Microbacterium aurum TaxID=36805 RepID=A0A1P8U8U1_9MICO|nr:MULTISPECIES: preprotein translocase subunit YajC [Microbacterium]MBZ6371497.1 preprotein translocase subunit YajC [Microbacterium hominis]APZ34529.1 preprotein translocase subunit YajC [Microbacterium aurum]MBD3758817.1 preprotein translocase subunit YajC [Microbacterium sp.]MBM7828409.1 preprotein translocase subunit YajC [Microbacterium aurum]MCG7413792.1 preprotein translocase subunit YajC [Microbacterium aurum]